jgi:hypothetical protein
MISPENLLLINLSVRGIEVGKPVLVVPSPKLARLIQLLKGHLLQKH